MMRSLFSGVSGLRNHQVRMDVIGNNVANVNTLAFKSGRVTFQEGFAQMLQNANRPQGELGGTNPMQVGLGMQVGSIDTLFSQGSIENTGIATDLAVQGDAFFAVSDGSRSFYTRAGNFQLDAGGRLVSPTTGFVLQGRMATNGEFANGITDIRLPFGQKTPALATTKAVLGGNLDASAPAFMGTDIFDPAQREANPGSYSETSITTYDSLGAKQELKIVFYKDATAPNTWNYAVDPSTLSATEQATLTGATGKAVFKTDGTLDTTTSSFPPVGFTPDGASALSITLDTGDGLNALSQFASRSTATFREQDGYTMGTLDDFGIDQTGTISGTFTNGVTVTLGQIALADFNNPGGLERTGDNMYSASANSGEGVLGFAGEGSASFISSRSLEMSNVDLAQEFTNMIVAQRGFQANGRVITTTDEMLQEVVGLKR